jgi:hypothetical protein
MSSINGIEAVELLGSADPAAADAVRKRGRKPVVERTAAQPSVVNGIEGIIFGTASSGPGSVMRLDTASPTDAQAARQRGQRALIVVDSSGAIVPSAAIPVNTVLPVISGGSSPPKSGELLTASTGTWTGSPAPTYAYQWKDDGANIGGATASTFSLTDTQIGGLITVTVTATNIHGVVSATSAAVGPIDAADVTAPTLSSFSATRLTETTASLSVATNEGNGTIYFVIVADGSAAPSKAQVKAGQNGAGSAAVWSGNTAVATIDTYTSGPTGLTAATAYDAYAMHEDVGGNQSTVVTADLALLGGGDVTAPILSLMDATPGADHRTMNVAFTTDTGEGTAYYVIVPGADSTPSAAQVEAGQNAAGAAATASGSLAISSSGAKTLTTGRALAGGTSYKACVTHKDMAGNRSTVVDDTVSTDTVVFSSFTDGLSTGWTPTGAVFTTGSTDSDAGANAVTVTDSNDAAISAVQIVRSSTVFNGVNRVRHKTKYVSKSGAALWMRTRMTSITGAGDTHHNMETAATGTSTATWSNVTATSIGGGWIQFDGLLNAAGADVTGFFQTQLGDADNDATVLRNGTNVYVIYDLHVTRTT